MKYIFCLIIIFLISCNSKNKEHNISVDKKNNSSKVVIKKEKNICWIGTLNSRIPIFLHYQIIDNLISGEITYLNTKERKPIKVKGTFENKHLRILEFEKNGNITGVISGIPNNENFNGSWFSPKTKKELSLELVKSDSIIYSKNIDTKIDNVYGEYHYQYSETGYQGDVTLTKIDNQNASFNIFSVTAAPSRNIADMETDTIKLNKTEFVYNLPESDGCEVKVQFFKDFVYINYTKGYCLGQFGHNATIDGIFIKTK